MEYSQLGLILSLHQSLKYTNGAWDKFSSNFFAQLAERNNEAMEIFQEAIQNTAWRRAEIVKKLFDFMVTFAQDSTPVMAMTFKTSILSQRAKEYAFLGISNRMFEAFVESWLEALRLSLDAEDVTDAAIAAWRYLLNVCVDQISQEMGPRDTLRPRIKVEHSSSPNLLGKRDERDPSPVKSKTPHPNPSANSANAAGPSSGSEWNMSEGSAEGGSETRSARTPQRRQLVKTPTVNEKLRDRAPSLTGGMAPFAKAVSATSLTDASKQRRGSTAARMEGVDNSGKESKEGKESKVRHKVSRERSTSKEGHSESGSSKHGHESKDKS